MKKLYEEINDFVKDNSEYSKDDAFVIWFINSQTNDKDKAISHLKK